MAITRSNRNIYLGCHVTRFVMDELEKEARERQHERQDGMSRSFLVNEILSKHFRKKRKENGDSSVSA